MRLLWFRKRLSFVVAILTLPASLHADALAPYKAPQLPLEDRVEALFAAMTPEERLKLLAGQENASSNGIPRLGVGPMVMVDATQGAHGCNPALSGKATMFTSGVLLAASWDPDLASRIGQGVATEALNKGTGGQVLLGPGLNILRTPLGGRSGEYIGGEDPYLTSRLAVGYVNGVQSTGCAACIKHYACNNQDFLRGIIDVHVGERALREIYTPAFIAAVREAHVWTAMSAYNKINGAHAITNWYTLHQILKTEAGFDGLAMTDWYSAGSTLKPNDGCDLEMPNDNYGKPPLLRRALESGDLLQANVDDSVRRVLRTMIRVGLLDAPRVPDHAKLNTPAHQHLALEAAEKGIALLKNDQSVLPLDAAKIQTIALIGPACKSWLMGCAGSANVDPFQSISAYDGIVARAKTAGRPINVLYDYGYPEQGDRGRFAGKVVPATAFRSADGKVEGLTAEYFNDYDFSKPPATTRVDPQVNLTKAMIESAALKSDHFGVRWTGTMTVGVSGTYRMNFHLNTMNSYARLFVGEKPVMDLWPGSDGSHVNGAVDLVAGQAYPVRIEYLSVWDKNPVRLTWVTPGEDLFASAVQAAKSADVAVVFVGTTGADEEEGRDRHSMHLPGVQENLIRAVAAANPKTVVVLNNGGPVLVTDWIDRVPGVIEAFLPAQSGGEALAKILFGDVNPSGKLPYTIGRAREDYPDFGHYPVEPETFRLSHLNENSDKARAGSPVVDYAEGIYVGYRWFDKKQIEPSFPFGYGLSYTTFQYANARVSSPVVAPSDRVTVTADVTNTGLRDGTEIVQLYLHALEPKIDRPINELKGFTRVALKAGETKSVSFTVAARDLAYCDVAGKQWKADAGEYAVRVCASSRDVRLTADLRFSADYTEALPGMGAASP
ncbi:MAG: glycoside hydrolase family 3 domain protein, partial [Phycisphaerales bacterium]|nr:glycoside hydrolase family 3 domain protein [Phycisphaerales bacterium]